MVGGGFGEGVVGGVANAGDDGDQGEGDGVDDEWVVPNAEVAGCSPAAHAHDELCLWFEPTERTLDCCGCVWSGGGDA